MTIKDSDLLASKKLATRIAVSDLNLVVDNGFYRLGTGITNQPPGVSVNYGQLIVSRGGDTILQIVTGHNDGLVFFRHGNPPDVGGSGVWTAWRPMGNRPVRSVTDTSNYMYGETQGGLNTINLFAYAGKIDKYMPASPKLGDEVTVIVTNGRNDNALHVDNIVGSQVPIMGLNEAFTIDKINADVRFVYIGGSIGWRLMS